MIQVHDNDTGVLLGDISEAQLQFLIDHLEETSRSDQDYYIDAATLEVLTEAGGDPTLLDLLRRWMGTRTGFEIRWSRPGDDTA